MYMTSSMTEKNTMPDLINQTIIDVGLQIQEDTGFAFNYEVF